MKKSVYLVIALLLTILACFSCAKQKAAEETLIIYQRLCSSAEC